MDLSLALTRQFRAGLAMLDDCIVRCPDTLWTEGRHPRTFWRIAYHALFYTHMYLMPKHEDFQPWDRHVSHGPVLWDDDEGGVPPREHPYTRDDLREYLRILDANIASWIEAIDLDSTNSGFPWYPIPKLEHVLVTLRHLGIHVGQLQERLLAEGIDPKWVGSVSS